MFGFLMFSVIVASACSNVLVEPPPMDGRIVGGREIKIESRPFQVSVRYKGRHMCGGSILTNNAILTAAHCLHNLGPSFISVQYGVSVLGGDKNVILAERIVVNENYDPFTSNGDIALIILNTQIPFSDTAKPIAVATETPLPNTKAVVSGWGRLSEGGSNARNLQSVEVTIVELSVCQEQYKKLMMDDDDYYNEDEEIITNKMLCAGVNGGGKDACQGDSGGPLTVDGVQVGIVSWGIGCARPRFFGIYTNVAEMYSWIVENLK